MAAAFWQMNTCFGCESYSYLSALLACHIVWSIDTNKADYTPKPKCRLEDLCDIAERYKPTKLNKNYSYGINWHI